MKFQVFKRGTGTGGYRREPAPPRVTVSKKGKFTFSRAAVTELFGDDQPEPGSVHGLIVLTTNDDPDVFGFRIVPPGSPLAYTFRVPADTNKAKAAQFSAIAFARAARLEHESTVRYPLETIVDGKGNRVLIARRTKFEAIR